MNFAALLATAVEGAGTNTAQVVSAMLGIVGVLTGGYGIWRTHRIDSRAAKSSDVADALGVMSASNAMVKEDLAVARKRIADQEKEIDDQSSEMAFMAQELRDHQQHIIELERKVVSCERLCNELRARLDEKESDQ